MGKLTIKSSKTAIDDATLVLRCADSFSSIVNTMTTAKNSLEGEWVSDAKNKQTISGNLNVTIDYYTKSIIESLNKLGVAISTYVNNVEQVSSNTEGSQGSVGVANPSLFAGANIIKDTVADSNGPSFDQDRYNALGGGNSLYDGSYSKEEFLNMVTNFGNNNLGTNTIGNSPVNVKTGYETNMLPYAEAFYDEAVSRGLDPAFVFAIGCQESGYGSSWNAVNKGNLFGMGAFDDSPSNAFSYDSVQAAIADVCDNIATNYVTPGGKFYTGSNISSIGQTYAGDPNWANSVTYIMNWIKDSKSL